MDMQANGAELRTGQVAEKALAGTTMRGRPRWLRFLAVAGPGMVVMLADTDAGSLVTAAQSGAESGYRLLLLQAVMVPILFVVQELTVRLGMLGASLVAAIVVALTAARALGEVIGFEHSLRHRPQEVPWFYGAYALILALGGVLVASGANLVELSVGVQVMNALLLPIVLGFLFLLARRVLPEPYRLKGAYAVVVGTTIALTAGLGLYAGIAGLLA